MHAAAAAAGARRAASQRGPRIAHRPAAAPRADPMVSRGMGGYGPGWPRAGQSPRADSADRMQVGTDEGIVALGYQESKGGKSLADTKVRYSWALSLDGRTYHIDFTNSKTSGKKRIFVDGRLQTEQKVYRSPTFQYSWPLGTHLLSIVPKQSETPTSVFGQVTNFYNDKVDCTFELRINGLPFHNFSQGSRASPFAEPQQGRPPSRPAATDEDDMPFATAHRDREYADMQRRAESVRQRSEQPEGGRGRRRAPSGEEADSFNNRPARSLTPTKQREGKRPSDGADSAGSRKGSSGFSSLTEDQMLDSSGDEDDDSPFFRYAGGANSGRSPSSFASSLFGKRSTPPRSPASAAATSSPPPAGASPWSSVESPAPFPGSNQAGQRPKASSPNPWGEFEGFGFPSGTASGDAAANTAAFASQDSRTSERPTGGGPAVDPWGATLPQDPWGRSAQGTPQSPPTPSRTLPGLSAIRKTVPTKLLPWEPKAPGQSSPMEKRSLLEADADGAAPFSAEQPTAITGDDDVDVEEQLAILASLEASRADSPTQGAEPLLGASTPSASPQTRPSQAPASDAWRSQAGAPDPWGSSPSMAAAPREAAEASQWATGAADPWGSVVSAANSNEQPLSASLDRKPLVAGFPDPWGSAVSTAAPNSPIDARPGGDSAPLLSGTADPWGSFPSKEVSPGEQLTPPVSSSSDPWSSFGLPAYTTASGATSNAAPSLADPWGGVPAAALGSQSQADPWGTSPAVSPAKQVADPWAALGAPAAGAYPSGSAVAMPSAEGYAKFEGDGGSTPLAAEADPWSSFGGPAVATALPPRVEGYGQLREDAASPTGAADPWGSLGSSTPVAAQPASFGSTSPHASSERWPPW